MRTALGITLIILAIASCAVPQSEIAASPPTTPATTISSDESGAAAAFLVDRTLGSSKDGRPHVVDGGRYKFVFRFRDGREFRTYCSIQAGTIAEHATALADVLRKKGLEVEVVPEFGAFRVAFTTGLCWAEASGPDGFTSEINVGRRRDFAPNGTPTSDAIDSMWEITRPVASLRMRRFESSQYGRVGRFELRNLLPDTLYYDGISADSPCCFKDETWMNGDTHRRNVVTCGNGVSRFSLTPGAIVEFTELVSEDEFSYLRSVSIGVYLTGVPGTIGRSAEVRSEFITADTK